MKRFRDGQVYQGNGSAQTSTARKYFPPQGKAYGGGDADGKGSKNSNDPELDYAKSAYGTLVAKLLESGISIDRLVQLLREQDEDLQQIFKKMRELRDTIKTRRPNALPFLRLSYYSGLHLGKSQFTGNADQITITFNDSPLDSIQTQVLHTQQELDAYCNDLVNLLEGQESRERLNGDKELARMSMLIKKLPTKGGDGSEPDVE